MFVKFYGCRGSLPTPTPIHDHQEKLRDILSQVRPEDIESPESIEKFIGALPFYLRSTYGGNTSCIYINVEGTHVILDMGSGLRALGMDLLTKDFGTKSDEMFVFISHTHWDHIQGLPFFVPAYLEGNTINFYSPHVRLQDKLEMQQYTQYFPVSLAEMGAQFNYHHMQEKLKYNISNFKVSSMRLNHPNNSYAFKIEYKDKKIVYATDSEFNDQSLDFLKHCIDFFHQADVLIFDSQYTSKESFEKLHWGHSSANTAIDIGLKSEVQRLVFFHHDPAYSDKKLSALYREVLHYRDMVSKNTNIELMPAYDGLEIQL